MVQSSICGNHAESCVKSIIYAVFRLCNLFLLEMDKHKSFQSKDKDVDGIREQVEQILVFHMNV